MTLKPHPKPRVTALIKPENFIVVENCKRTLGNNWELNHSLGVQTSVMVKRTDWGLGTSPKAHKDLNGGSKPYMAYSKQASSCFFHPFPLKQYTQITQNIADLATLFWKECCNKLNQKNNPVQVDIWSLRIVLLNLLYHCCPWADPGCLDVTSQQHVICA
ncbi:uncharacterized protein VP01_754g1 [Puccinia sorghi]|uniref:Protein kinase domain-containing protein n=1 Tax=Puccinia sorghi TaxID=27349 RepID=A0A0L6UC51_9BASI|nr:uncharacterized protein VP01_754g1 [Puccinia sorghi]